jgi:hypothetical protein
MTGVWKAIISFDFLEVLCAFVADLSFIGCICGRTGHTTVSFLFWGLGSAIIVPGDGWMDEG